MITIETKKITESTAGFCDIIDLTAKLKEHIHQAKIRAGTATLFGPSLAIPIVNGAPSLGTWQQVILLDFDNRPRTREIIVQLIGEKE